MRRNITPAYPGGRPTCFKCIRPVSHCVCNIIPEFYAHFNILILQHPNERKKYYGTAKLVASAVKNSKLLRGIEFEEENLRQQLKGQTVYLLYPGTQARDASDVPLGQHDTVIVIDGTWSEAGKIIKRNPFLKDIPRISFKAIIKSEYKIRKQPKESCLSTIESIGYLLKSNILLQDPAGKTESYDGLFAGFSKMIEQQLASIPNA